MTESERPKLAEKAPEVFTDDHQLALLQLLIRKSMSSRMDTCGDDDADPEETGTEEASQSETLGLPVDWRLMPENISLHAWQRECLPLWLSKGRGTVKVATGGGKTLFALAAAERLQNTREPDLRLVIVVPTIPLMFQWYDELKNSNLPLDAIGLMGGNQDLSPSGRMRVLICVLASARDRLETFINTCGWSHSPIMLVVDECHHANAAQGRRIFAINAPYTLGLSATPEQDAEADGLPTDQAYEQSAIGQGLGPIIYSFSLRQSLEAGLLTPFEVWHIGLPLATAEAEEHRRLSTEISDLRRDLQRRHQSSRSQQGFLAWCQTQASRKGPSASDAERFIGLANRRKRLLYRAAARSRVVLDALTTSAADEESRVIVFHESIEEIERLFLDAVGSGLPVVLEHSKLPDGLRAENINAFRRGVARGIISAKSLVEGFNVPSADLGIVAASTSSVRQRIQSLGRMLRRKAGNRHARVIVLYVRDTEDEAIYQKADWENVVGAERNRYFVWSDNPDARSWQDHLTETNLPPRTYRPPSWEVESLNRGDFYPGQTDGLELKVDQGGNLRTADGGLVKAAPEAVASIPGLNSARRAVRTPAGHLIVRCDGPLHDQWQFLGMVDIPEAPLMDSVRLQVKAVRGRKVLAKKVGNKEFFARAAENGASLEADKARQCLLEWIAGVEQVRNVPVKELFWDGAQQYWLEVEGQRIEHEGQLAALEFRG